MSDWSSDVCSSDLERCLATAFGFAFGRARCLPRGIDILGPGSAYVGRRARARPRFRREGSAQGFQARADVECRIFGTGGFNLGREQCEGLRGVAMRLSRFLCRAWRSAAEL